MAKVESLYGTTPAEIFESGLENVNDIVGVATAVMWKDGRIRWHAGVTQHLLSP